MTFGIAFASPLYAGVVTDRRISGAAVDDEYTKFGVVELKAARFAYTFTGVATVARVGFDAATWLPEALCRAGGPDGRHEAWIENFRIAATQQFSRLPISAKDKRTSFVFVGFVDDTFGQGHPAIHMVSNFQKLETQASSVALPAFQVSSQQLPPNGCAMRAIGSGTAVALNFDQVANLVARGVHPGHVTNAAVELIRAAAGDSKTAGTVGRICSCAFIGRRSTQGVFTDYQVDQMSATYRAGAYVCANYGRRGAWIITRPEYTGFDADGRPLPVRTKNVRKNAPCPCGSGMRYRECHRHRERYSVPSMSSTFDLMLVKAPEEDISIVTAHGGHVGGRRELAEMVFGYSPLEDHG